MQRLADRNEMPLPERLLNEHGRFHYGDFLDFLRTYDLAASVIRTAEDYRDITYEYLRDCAAEGAIYVELTASPDHARLVGLSRRGAPRRDRPAASTTRAALHGIEGRILISAVRNFGLDRALAVARYAAAETHPYVVGFSMAGDEANFPIADFAEPYAIAAEAGPRVHGPRRRVGGPGERARRAHPAGHPHRPRRPGHRGCRAGGRARRVRGMVLNTCPTSNVVLGVFPGFDEHPLPQLRDAGVRLTLGSDDPAVLRGDDRRRV